MCQDEKKMTKCKNRLLKRTFREKFLDSRTIFDKHFRKAERRFKKAEMMELETLCTTDQKKFYDQLRKLGPKRKRKGIPGEVIDSNGNVVFDDKSILDKWKNDFKTLYRGDDDSIDREFNEMMKHFKNQVEGEMLDPLYENSSEMNREISLVEVRNVAMRAKNGKATGGDQIPYEILKYDNVMYTLCKLYQLCFDSGKVPSEWNSAIIFPIPKSKLADARVPLNYRGVSLLSTISKLYTSILNERLREHCENDILTDEQNGFRKNRSCVDHIYVLTSIIKNKINKGKPVFACFIDFKKAFDLVNRDLMLVSLYENGIQGNIYFAIKSLYQRTKARVQVNDKLTDWFATYSGVRQGDSMSPTLFSIFLNSLSKDLGQFNSGISVFNRSISHLLYADDLVLLAEN